MLWLKPLLHAVQKLTGLAYRLAEIVVKDVRRSVAFVRGQSGVEQPSRASQLMMNVQEQLTRKAHRYNLHLGILLRRRNQKGHQISLGDHRK
jgi:hypothetical protein